MTKLEYNKCVKLMKEAIEKATFSEECWKAYEKYKEEENHIDAEIKLRLFENSHGYAEGINQTLAILGFKHEKMEELERLL